MTSRVVGAITAGSSSLRAKAERLCYRAGMALINLSGQPGRGEWFMQVERADRVERALQRSINRTLDEQQRGNRLFASCALALNLLVDGQVDKAMSQLRLAVIAGRRKP